MTGAMDLMPARPCAYCRARPVERPWRPFCSERCKLLDLARWVDGEYRIPGEPVPAGDAPVNPPPDDGETES